MKSFYSYIEDRNLDRKIDLLASLAIKNNFPILSFIEYYKNSFPQTLTEAFKGWGTAIKNKWQDWQPTLKTIGQGALAGLGGAVATTAAGGLVPGALAGAGIAGLGTYLYGKGKEAANAVGQTTSSGTTTSGGSSVGQTPSGQIDPNAQQTARTPTFVELKTNIIQQLGQLKKIAPDEDYKNFIDTAIQALSQQAAAQQGQAATAQQQNQQAAAQQGQAAPAGEEEKEEDDSESSVETIANELGADDDALEKYLKQQAAKYHKDEKWIDEGIKQTKQLLSSTFGSNGFKLNFSMFTGEKAQKELEKKKLAIRNIFSGAEISDSFLSLLGFFALQDERDAEKLGTQSIRTFGKNQLENLNKLLDLIAHKLRNNTDFRNAVLNYIKNVKSSQKQPNP